jgi:hypothetical protein
MQSTMDIKDEKEQHNAFEKAWDSNCNAFGWQYYGCSHMVKSINL